MFENRFRDLLPQDDPAPNHTSSAFAFFPLAVGSSMPDQGLSWLYQRAFECARDSVMAHRQREFFEPSLN